MITLLAVKATLAVAIAFLLVVAARRSRASLRHLILAACFAFLLLTPFVQRYAPIPISVDSVPAAVAEAIAPAGGAVAASATEAGGQSGPRSTDWIAIARNLYFGGAALLLLMLAAGVVRLWRLADRSHTWLEGTARMNEIANEEGIRRPALVVLARSVSVPLTFGFRRSIIVLPEAAKEWSADELARALRHELEHVRRDDWALQLIARAACALYWPHPLVWVAWGRFCLEAERACDDAVVNSGQQPDAYAGQLVSLARSIRHGFPLPALGMAARSRLSERVSALLDRTLPRGPHGRLAAVAVFSATLAFLVSVAPAQLTAAAEMDKRFDDDELSASLGIALLEAAQRGNIRLVQRLLDNGVDVNQKVYGDGSALIVASRAGEIEMVRFLLDRGADPNLAVHGDGNPLIAAARSGHYAITELLLDRGAHVNDMVASDENALIQASAAGQVEIVRLLIARGADVNASVRTDEGELRSPLRMAQRSGYDEIVRILLNAGAKE